MCWTIRPHLRAHYFGILPERGVSQIYISKNANNLSGGYGAILPTCEPPRQPWLKSHFLILSLCCAIRSLETTTVM